MAQAIHISPIDNVVVALHPIAKGELVQTDGLSVTALEDIPQGHKMAVRPIRAGENVVKYGFAIGHATEDAQPGRWMHTHNVKTNLSGEVEYSYDPAPDLAPLPRVEPETFMGFRRKDGRAAIRNEIWIIPVVGCVNENAKKMVQDNQDLVTGSIEGLYTFPHPFGCSQTGHDHAQTRKLLAALVRHPNAAGVLVLHLGCENIQPDQFKAELGEYDPDRVKFLVCQDVEDEFAAARKLLEELADYARQFERQPIPVSELVVGMKCGGSDGLSGNKQGGITTLEDKSCGCVQKGGTAPIMDVIDYGDPVVTKGLNMLYGPGNDLVSATAMTAAGAHMILFSTGRGTPFSAPAPTLKISTNTPLAEKKPGWIDFNAGVIADGKKTIDQTAQDLLQLVIDTASGKQTKAEINGFRDISIFKDGVVL